MTLPTLSEERFFRSTKLLAQGPRLLESSHEASLGHELMKEGLIVKHQVGLPLIYDGLNLDVGYWIDVLVENKVIVEIKSVENLADVYHKQILTYLRLSGLKIGILVNFNTANI
jgi:GxxExxY protein